MRKHFFLLLFFFCSLFAHPVFAILNLELTRGVAGAVPISVVPFLVQGETPSQDVSGIVSNDLKNSGRFKMVYPEWLTVFPHRADGVSFDAFKQHGVDHVLVGEIQQKPDNRYQVTVQLLDVFKGKETATTAQEAVSFEKRYVVSFTELRSLAHRISDDIYQHITGTRGIFSTRLAYIVLQRLPNGSTRHVLEVSDQDGYHPRPLLTSPDPVMSPSWSPNGKQIAYVSFENRQSAIYVQDVATGARRLVSRFPGINGAPAWSPDGRRLAVALSKTGALNIYIMDLMTQQLTPLTNDYYINTEPSWSPDGRTIIYTSNRGGGKPQIYQIRLDSKAISRLTYEGKYNARASYAPDGNHIVVLNQDSGVFNIGTLDLDSGVFRVLTNSGIDSQSPSMAPNGSMVLFGTLYKGRSILEMVATDGSVQIRLPAPNGEVQDPAWSPFLS